MKNIRFLGLTITSLILIGIGLTPKSIAQQMLNPPNTTEQISADDDQKNNTAAPILSSQQEEQEFIAKLQEQRNLELENTLIRGRLDKELAYFRAEIEKLRLQREYIALKWEIEQEEMTRECAQQLIELNKQKEKIMAEVALSQAKLTQSMEDFNTVYNNMQNQTLLLKSTIDQVKTEIEDKKIQKERKFYADGVSTYLEDPLLPDGTLVVSDRSVELNGVITAWKASYVADSITFFNNQDKKKPIFILIENSPGGSIVAGQYILQAMHNSTAPVYVVVKGFAASMAALITTLASKSYAYPNAMILHHQPWTCTVGNLRELKEEVALLQEWWVRLGGEIAKKMKISLAKLDQLLYEKSSRGDWMEFADLAKKHHWVDHIIKGIRDTSTRELPNSNNYTAKKYIATYFSDSDYPMENTNGKIYLPQLAAKDFYYLYNPDNRYQMRG